QTIVTVEEGVVALQSRKSPDAALKLTAGQQGFVEGVAAQAQPSFNPLSTSAWRRGQVVFRQTPLAKAIDEVNRYRSAPIILMSKDVRALPVSGTFDLNDTDGIVKTIERELHLDVTWLPGGAVLLF